MFGAHAIKYWSVNQQVVALSSGEAEYYGIVKGATITMGMQSMLRDFGIDVGIVISTDASAVVGIASRRGLGKVRHIDVCQLWIQDHVAQGSITLVKVAGDEEDRANIMEVRTIHSRRQAPVDACNGRACASVIKVCDVVRCECCECGAIMVMPWLPGAEFESEGMRSSQPIQ